MKNYFLFSVFVFISLCGFTQTTSSSDSLIKARTAELEQLKPIFKQKKTTEDSLFTAVQSDVFLVTRINSTGNPYPVPGATKNYYNDQCPGNAEKEFASAKPGDVIGPFVSGNVIGIYKIKGHELAEDCVMVRHLLIAYRDAARAPVMSRSRRQAKELADSLCKVIVSGKTEMTDLIMSFTDDPGSKLGNLGNYGMFTRETGFVKEFKDAGFNNPVGATVVVETEFGFHVIQVLDKKINQTFTKVYALERVIDPDMAYLAQQSGGVTLPVFPGGIAALEKYLADSLRYPPNAKAQHKEACVEMMFKVGKDGKIYDVAEARNGPAQDPELIAEAKRLLVAMPLWKPAVYKEKEIDWILRIKVRFTLPG